MEPIGLTARPRHIRAAVLLALAARSRLAMAFGQSKIPHDLSAQLVGGAVDIEPALAATSG
jgi:hypothetical protein